jgi:FAD:protein FMN transferase
VKMQRRARPLLGTLVEVGLDARVGAGAFDAAFDAVSKVQSRMSRFEPASDLARFHALPAGAAITVDEGTAAVLHAALALQAQSDGLFDIALGSAKSGWHCEARRLTKLDAGVRLDLGGIAKGYAVDRAVDALRDMGCEAGWVNAGGDLRVFGAVELPVSLRDEKRGGARHFGHLSDGALATSRFGQHARSAAWSGSKHCDAHVTVVAPRCLWADALTKVVALSGNVQHPLLARHGAQAWIH